MLDRLQPRPGARHRKKRVGRGPGSGLNKTSGRGMKGQGHRSSGVAKSLSFEGDQMPITRRLPKRGFHNRSRVVFRIVNLGSLSVFGEGATVDAEALAQRGLISRRGGGVKLLASGDAPKGLTVRVKAASAAAVKKVEEAGGSVELV